MSDLDSITRKFLLEEGKGVGVSDYIQNLREILENMKPVTQTESRRNAMAMQNVREIRRCVRKMENKMKLLEERISILEESR